MNKMTTPIAFRIDKDLYERIKKAARVRAVKEDKDCSWRYLIREVLSRKYPEQPPRGAKK